jgi:hypothetical protein
MEMLAYGTCGNDVPLSISSAAVHVLFLGGISIIVDEAGVNPPSEITEQYRYSQEIVHSQ